MATPQGLHFWEDFGEAGGNLLDDLLAGLGSSPSPRPTPGIQSHPRRFTTGSAAARSLPWGL